MLTLQWPLACSDSLALSSCERMLLLLVGLTHQNSVPFPGSVWLSVAPGGEPYGAQRWEGQTRTAGGDDDDTLQQWAHIHTDQQQGKGGEDIKREKGRKKD